MYDENNARSIAWRSQFGSGEKNTFKIIFTSKLYENNYIAIVMSSSLADPVLGLNILLYRADWRDLNIQINATARPGWRHLNV